jgi:hypothetical protein
VTHPGPRPTQDPVPPGGDPPPSQPSRKTTIIAAIVIAALLIAFIALHLTGVMRAGSH